MSIPLSRACLCADCSHISAPKGDACEHCGSSAIFPLYRWIEELTAHNAEITILERMYRRG